MMKAPSKTRRSAASVRFHLRVALLGASPPIWRLVEVPGAITLGELHDVVQTAMGWEDSHLHMFEVGKGRKKRTYSANVDESYEDDIDEDSVLLRDILRRTGSKMHYIYDLGDRWRHLIRVEKRWTDTTGLTGFRCLEGGGACPPEDCGGIWGYRYKLIILSDPNHPERGEIFDWFDDDFDPDRFDVDAVNEEFDSWGEE